MNGGQFEALFSSVRIRDVEIPNRIAASGLGWNWAGMGGAAMPSPMLAQIWGARAANGLGFIISESQSVHPTSTANPQVIENSSDDVIEPYRAVTAAVHEHGTKIVAQLNHAGHLGGTGFRNTPLWAPSAVRAPMGMIFPQGGGVIPHAMSVEEIAEVTEAFAAAAARDIDAGFDGVEINAAEGFLLAEFLSPLLNRRSDDYGGSAEARHRLLLEVVAAVRERIGNALLGVRIGSEDHLEGGLDVDGVREVAAALGGAGTVDYLSTTPSLPPNMGHEPGAYSELAIAAKEASGLPIIYMGWVDGPQTAESLLAAGVCDLVGMSRATLADSELPKKARAGDIDGIRPCIACNECLTAGLGCPLNPGAMLVGRPGAAPTAGAEAAGEAAEQKKLLVIGGGPAGVEAATALAKRGHEVTIWERESALGGQLAVAARAPHRERMGVLADYLERQLKGAGVTVELEHAATADEVRAFGADAVVVATGGGAYVPDVPGVDQPNVVGVREALNGEIEAGERVLVILGRSEHRYQGLTTAESIAAQGKQVWVATNAHYAGDLWEQTIRLDTYRRLALLGVEFTPMVELVAIRENRVEMRNVYSHEPLTFEMDTIVLAYGDDANSGLLNELEESGTPVLSVGDVVAPRDLQSALREGAMTALRV